MNMKAIWMVGAILFAVALMIPSISKADNDGLKVTNDVLKDMVDLSEKISAPQASDSLKTEAFTKFPELKQTVEGKKLYEHLVSNITDAKKKDLITQAILIVDKSTHYISVDQAMKILDKTPSWAKPKD